MLTDDHAITLAAEAIATADALLVTAGAGMGIESGLPDFRGERGFWRAYPAYAQLGLSFMDLANPRWFREDPELAWGFYGHRLNLYRATRPHAGFALLKGWSESFSRRGFVLTSNIDSQFQLAGFDLERIVEAHGTLEVWQCTRRCGIGLFPAAPEGVVVDPATFRAAAPLPACLACGALARPNVLLFGDDDWDETRTLVQQRRLESWLVEVGEARGRLVIVECGAGTAVPTIRAAGDSLARRMGATLIRLNPDPGVSRNAIVIGMGTAALARIDAELTVKRPRH